MARKRLEALSTRRPAPFNPALAELAARLPAVGALPASSTVTPPPARPAPPPATRAVVRMERSGRGGKTVTVVEKLGLPARELERWQAELKRALGTGGALEGSSLVVQGDVRDRVAAWLGARGVGKVTVA